MVIVSSLSVLEGCSASLQWVTETGTWNHQQQSGHISSFHFTRSRLAPAPSVSGCTYRVTTRGMSQEKNTESLLPAHFTPWAMRPHMKLAQYSHQCGPLNVCTWKTAAERKITEIDPTISQTSVSTHLNGAEFLFFEGTTCRFWKLPFITAGKEEKN